jgi:hypothetical protein
MLVFPNPDTTRDDQRGGDCPADDSTALFAPLLPITPETSEFREAL